MKRIAIDNDGFTLMELMVVVAIIGIAAAVAIPTLMSELPKFKVNGAVRNLASDMQWAKMKAVAENNEFALVILDGADSYAIYDDDDNEWSTTGDNKLVKTVTLPTGIRFGRALSGIKRTGSCSSTIDTDGVHLPTNISWPGSGEKITFQTNGLPSSGASLYLIPSEDVSVQRTDRWRAISVSTTGRIKAWKYNTASTDTTEGCGVWSPL